MLIARPRPRSLADEPLAAAMRALPPMAAGTRELVRERLWKLTSADRGECVDFTFGDSEIYWYTPGAKSPARWQRGITVGRSASRCSTAWATRWSSGRKMWPGRC